MKPPPAVVVGPGRSGSGYLAKLLTRCGVRCGHEGWWNPRGDRLPGLDCDSSWCALAAEDLPETVLCQVRHPLAVCSSMLHHPSEAPYRELRLELLAAAGVPVPATPEGFAAAATLVSTRAAVARASWRWRLEDIDHILLSQICARLGHRVDGRLARRALAAIDRNVNQHTWQPRVAWADLPPAGGLRDQLRALTRELGYPA